MSFDYSLIEFYPEVGDRDFERERQQTCLFGGSGVHCNMDDP